ncbi:LacI family transcriptional regulator [Caulobacter ginsengisoli]|uniref:LacI family transcriptional regulator n=1 Tax=Caulobacter ginsengisoli TaxID=400775 RepID=A0ABU0ITN6_9CAUL|nr:LacI family DNA-binding transcriptional regulator [Caulobacter ginsengisoli]MDQ0464327.1 LacI family transcriptional regulator [Caulobacter ginsengisoli]
MASVTIYDVAARADVSIKTVSRVMNSEPNVRQETRDRVLAAAEALGYHPNLSARSLAGSKSFVIAAFVDAALTMDHWRSERGADYLSRIQLGATTACREAGYHFMVELIDHATPRVRQEVGNLLAALHPDGVLLTPPSADDVVVLELLASTGTPFVRLGPENAAGGGLRFPTDDRAAAGKMTEHLVGLGHKKIAIILGEPRYAASRARREGFLAAMAEHGLSVPETWIQQGDFTFSSGVEAAEALLSLADRPTAIFASNDDMALGAMAAIAEAGLSTPEDISVAGFDDSSGGRFSRPQLTTMRQPLVEMAAFAAKSLIEGAVPVDCDQDVDADHLPASDLVVRRSTAPPRA